MTLRLAPMLALLLPLTISGQDSGKPCPTDPGKECDSSAYQDTWYLDYSECDLDRGQVSLLANVAIGKVGGTQASFLGNIATEEIKGFQMSLGFNYARHIEGSQLGWDLNLAKTVKGWQVGGLNIADTVKGAQIGFLNLSRELDGFAIGFLTFTRNGLLHLDALAEETGMTKVAFTTGKVFFTSLSLGYSAFEDNHPYTFGGGFGYQAAFGWGYLEAEVQGSLVADENTDWPDEDDWNWDGEIGESDWRHNYLVQTKIRVGRRLAGFLGLFGALSYNYLFTYDNGTLIGPANDDWSISSGDNLHWPGFEVGLRMGR